MLETILHPSTLALIGIFIVFLRNSIDEKRRRFFDQQEKIILSLTRVNSNLPLIVMEISQKDKEGSGNPLKGDFFSKYIEDISYLDTMLILYGLPKSDLRYKFQSFISNRSDDFSDTSDRGISVTKEAEKIQYEFIEVFKNSRKRKYYWSS